MKVSTPPRFNLTLLGLGLALLFPLVAVAGEEAAGTDVPDVRILRDTWGVPHIFGKTDADAAYGLAYAHAEDDFLTMQQSLLAARGDLAAIYGRSAAPNDYMVQLLRIWEFIDAGYETDLAPETRALAEAYAAGATHYGELHPDELLSDALLPITGKDIVAGFVHKVPLFFGLDKALQEITGPERVREVSDYEEPGPAAAWMFPETDAAIHGSNTFAVAPSRSADGWTRLNVNSHQPWEGPVAWYEAHVRSEEGWNMVGGVFPGTPFILHGHNPDLGWAHTVNRPDLIDIYVLTIDPEDEYRYEVDGEWKELERDTARIKVKLLGPLSWTFKRETLWSIYGPVMRSDHGTYAIRFANMGDLRYMEQGYRMNKARTFEEWNEAMSMLAMPMFNTIYADRVGNIHFVYNGAIPDRAEGYDWQQYLPGNTTRTLWTDYVPYDELPHVHNPESGFVINCNGSPFFTTVEGQNPDPANFSETMGIDTYITNREMRAMKLFGGDESITREEFYAYKFDMAFDPDSPPAKLVKRILDAPRPEDALMAQAVDVLATWDLQTNPENRAAALGVLTTYPVTRGWQQREDLSDEVPMEELWDALRNAANELQRYHERLDPEWQEVNRLRRGHADLGVGGGPDILHAVYGAGPEEGRLTGRAGDSYVVIAEWDNEGNVHSESIHQYGSATMDETSPHYADQAELFVRREMKPVWLTEEAIRANLELEYRPGEEPREEEGGFWPW